MIHNNSAVAGEGGLRVDFTGLLVAAAAFEAHPEQATAAAGLRPAAGAAGHTETNAALSGLAEQFRTALSALDRDRAEAVLNLRFAARTYEAIEIRILNELRRHLGHPEPQPAPGAGAAPAPSPHPSDQPDVPSAIGLAPAMRPGSAR
jgi:hypothetical protein